MLKIVFVLLSFFSISSYAVLSNVQMYAVAQNTLNTVRGLKELLTESREFSEEFEHVHRRVNQSVWEADRTALWLEDMHNLSTSKNDNADEFISTLSDVKKNLIEIKGTLARYSKDHSKTKQKKKLIDAHDNNAKQRSSKYISDLKSNLSSSDAQREIYKLNADILLEINQLNQQQAIANDLARQNLQLQRDIEIEKLKQEIRSKKRSRRLSKGVLRQEELDI